MNYDVSSPYSIIALLLAIGAAGGFLSGLLGVGGGIIFVPALYFAMTSFGIDAQHAMHLAVGSSLAVVFATGSVSALGHHRRGAVDADILRAWGPFIVAGVALGAAFASAVDGAALKRIFATLVFSLSFYMAFGRVPEKRPKKHRLGTHIQHVLCAAIGMVSSMIGVGGAILTVPMMNYTGMQATRALGTGAALGMIISLPGTLGYVISGFPHNAELPPFSAGYVNVLAVALIIPTSMLMAPQGVKVSHSLPPVTLRRIFAAVMLIVSVRMFMTL